MTEQQDDTTPRTAQDGPQEPQDPETAPEGTEPGNEPQDAPENPSREAAKWRRQLREAEARADTLTGRVVAMQRAEVERLAGADLATPGDLWLTGTTLGDVLDEAGDVDPTKVGEAAARVLADRPGWRRTEAPSFDGGARASTRPPASMVDVLRGRGGT